MEPSDEDLHVAGARIAFYWDDGCEAPLWDEEGNLPNDPDWLARELGFGQSLIADLLAWTDAQCQRPPGPYSVEELAAEERLFVRIQEELGDGLTAIRHW